MERPDVPARVVINEYINVAHSFFSEEEPKVVNGVLDKLARRLRAAEFNGNGDATQIRIAKKRSSPSSGRRSRRAFPARSASRTTARRSRREPGCDLVVTTDARDRRRAFLSRRGCRARSRGRRSRSTSPISSPRAQPRSPTSCRSRCRRRPSARGSQPSPTACARAQDGVRLPAHRRRHRPHAGAAQRLDHRLRHAFPRAAWCAARPRGRAIVVYVSGTIGDAALGLALRRDPALRAALRARRRRAAPISTPSSRRPQPPVALAPVAARPCAAAAMDISDGLVKDFDRLCRASGVGGRIEAAAVPLSAAARAVRGRGRRDARRSHDRRRGLRGARDDCATARRRIRALRQPPRELP